MLFYEPLFLFVFLPTFLLLYLAGARTPALRVGIVLAGSYLFYSWAGPLFPAIVLVSALIDHALARGIAHRPPGDLIRRWLLGFGIVLNLSLLVFYKYSGFLVENFNIARSAVGADPWSLPAIALPIGVSFVVFEKITYLVDIARGLSRPAQTLPRYLLYVFFFPKLLAGPIIKFHDIEAQIANPPPARADDLTTGFLRFMLGVTKKTLLADPVGRGVDMIFAPAAGAPDFRTAWLGAALFTFQIYFDFSAYSDMAIGLARMLGFRLLENFNWPYSSCSLHEFWRRWHISLSTWIRDYLYIPLGGGRVAPSRQYVNLWICFLASGLWHGAAWNFVAWGAWHGFFLTLERLGLGRVLAALPPVVANVWTFGVALLGWVLFRATSLGQAGAFYRAMVSPSEVHDSAQVFITNDINFALIACAVICVIPRLPRFARIREAFMDPLGTPALVLRGVLGLLFIWAVGKAVADPFKPFLYFRF